MRDFLTLWLVIPEQRTSTGKMVQVMTFCLGFLLNGSQGAKPLRNGRCAHWELGMWVAFLFLSYFLS